MATSLLRLGRLGPFKCLRLESLGILRSRSAASLCTQAAEPPATPVKKTKAASKTEAPDERATLLAYKTAVAFPARLSEPGVFPVQSLGGAEAANTTSAAVSEPEAAEAPAAELEVAHVSAGTAPPPAEPLVDASSQTSTPNDTLGTASATDDVVPAAPASSEPGDPAADESSSSSSSDSDSDSDSEDEKSEVNTETKTSPPEVSESTVKEDAEVQEVTPEGKEDTPEAKKEPEVAWLSTEAGQATIKVPAVTSEELVDPAPEICTKDRVSCPEVSAEAVVDPSPEAEVGDIPSETPSEVVIKAATAEEAASASAEAAEVSAPVESTKELVDAAPVLAEDASVEATEAEEAAAEDSAPEQSTVELVDPAPVLAEAAEAGAVPAEAAAVPAEAAAVPAEAGAAPAEAGAARVEAGAAVGDAAEVSAPVESTEELVDPTPVLAEAAGEELQADPAEPVEPSEEAAAAAPPEPDEPFDNSTYKNYQHHGYTPHTFADLDVEMAKFRLPQPSSIRH